MLGEHTGYEHSHLPHGVVCPVRRAGHDDVPIPLVSLGTGRHLMRLTHRESPIWRDAALARRLHDRPSKKRRR
ncbi:MAG: hypothetical protein AB8H86_31145, partial [Polyangiales bacterium]